MPVPVVLSSKPSGSNIPLIAGIVGGGIGVLIVSGVTVGLIWRYLKNKKNRDQLSEEETSSPSLELAPPVPSHGPPNIMSSNAFNPSGEGLEEARMTVKGNMFNKKFSFYFHIDREEAQLITLETGLIINFDKNSDILNLILGKGNFGQVRIAREVDTQKKLFRAIKIVAGEDNVKSSLREGRIQARLSDCENVLPLLEYLHYLPTPEKNREIRKLLKETFGNAIINGKDMTTQPLLLQISPLAAFGNGDTFKDGLSKVIDEELRNNLINHFATSILNGLKNMHDKGVSHLDIKPSNLLIHNDGTLYIGDFGCAQQKDYIKGGIGDFRYFSPDRLAHIRFLEQQQGQTYQVNEIQETFSGKAADIWAVGITLLEIIGNRYPLELASPLTRLDTWDINHYQDILYPYLSGREKLAQTNKSTFDLIEKLLEIDPKKRIAVNEAWVISSKGTDQSSSSITLFQKFKDQTTISQNAFENRTQPKNLFRDDKSRETKAQAEVNIPTNNNSTLLESEIMYSQRSYYTLTADPNNASEEYGANLKSFNTMVNSYEPGDAEDN